MFNEVTLSNLVINNPIIDLFICIAAGHSIGKIKFKNFQLNGLIGTLVCALIISQLGISISNDIKYFFFSIFIYGVGYTGGPQFFKSLHKTILKDIVLTIFITLISLITILSCCTCLHLSKGSAVGVVAGSLTQSGMLAAANFAISGLGLNTNQSMSMIQDMTDGFAITYFIGLISAMFLCVYGVEFVFKKNIRTDAIAKESEYITQQKITTICENVKPNLIKVDFMGIGLAIAIGLILGTITFHIKGCPICIGAIGLLISGLLSSWINTKKPHIAYIDNKTMHFIQDFVLNAFIAAVGLSAGSGAFNAILNNGINIVITGLATSIIPTILSIYFGKFVLKYKNTSIFG